MQDPKPHPESRTEYHREYQRRRRERESIRSVTVELTAIEWEALQRARLASNMPVEKAYKAFLLTGALFCANSGRPRGKKFHRADIKLAVRASDLNGDQNPTNPV